MLTIFAVLILIVSAAIVVYYAWYLGTPTPLQRAQDAHHADPPRGETALRHYAESMKQAPNTTAILEMAAIYDHGIYQGPEPVMPSPDQALELYREVAVVGAAVERELARERIIEIARDRQRVFNNPPPRRQHIVVVIPPPPLDVPRTDVDIIENVNHAPRSDSQNVHVCQGGAQQTGA